MISRFKLKNYKFIALFDKYLQKSVSHFTPSEDGGERLMIKYYHFLLQIKKVAHEKYKMNILQNNSGKNIDWNNFLKL